MKIPLQNKRAASVLSTRGGGVAKVISRWDRVIPCSPSCWDLPLGLGASLRPGLLSLHASCILLLELIAWAQSIISVLLLAACVQQAGEGSAHPAVVPLSPLLH